MESTTTYTRRENARRAAVTLGVPRELVQITIPTNHYLEACSGPVPIRKVIWVQMIPIRLRGDLAGRPLEFVDIQDEAVAAIRETRAVWTLREELWSLQGLFDDRPTVAIHLANPFRTDTRM